ncbi:MAG: hypothetical protein ACRDTA_00430, partial [Pseudonocardiaceae bacterium]
MLHIVPAAPDRVQGSGPRYRLTMHLTKIDTYGTGELLNAQVLLYSAALNSFDIPPTSTQLNSKRVMSVRKNWPPDERRPSAAV